ncbi:hypothetical protein PINS_up019116 [Pythium insidiosum]|nr:hypothetical protein PINS_up019116 [Pythium insidiosum]
MIADLLTQRGSVTGVDFSRSRLGACKQLVHKYGLLQSPTDATTTATAAASESHDDGNDTDAVATPPSTTSLPVVALSSVPRRRSHVQRRS